MTSKIEEQITEEQVKDNLETGIVMAIEAKKREFINRIDNTVAEISVKEGSKSYFALHELVRILKSAATFPNAVVLGKPSQRELDAVADLYAIKDLQHELAIITIARQQEENDNNTQTQENENE